MSDTSDPGINCPVGRVDCRLVDELRDLREEIRVLAKLSQTDPLTGLYNLRYMLNALSREMERTRRTRLNTALIMIDLDHFKDINDRYGHQVGNQALRWCSDLWQKEIRRIDMLCRYGGEEFGVVLPATRLSQAVRVAERLREKLIQLPMPLGTEEVLITASFGVDVYKDGDELTVEDFIERSDKYLLQAKIRGRNQVCYEKRKAAAPVTEVKPEERVAFFATRWPDTSREWD